MADHVLITGAGGVIGSHALDVWPPEDHVTALRGRQELDLLGRGAWDALVDGLRPDVIVHLAWSAGGRPDFRGSPDNPRWVESTLELSRVCRESGIHLLAVGTVVDQSSGARDAYSRSKQQLRHALGRHIDAGELAWVRPFYVFDPVLRRPGVLGAALAARDRHESVPLARPDSAHDFIHARDVAVALARVASERMGGVVDVGSGQLRTVSTLVERSGATWVPAPVEEALVEHAGTAAETHRLRATGWSPAWTDSYFDG